MVVEESPSFILVTSCIVFTLSSNLDSNSFSTSTKLQNTFHDLVIIIRRKIKRGWQATYQYLNICVSFSSSSWEFALPNLMSNVMLQQPAAFFWFLSFILFSPCHQKVVRGSPISNKTFYISWRIIFLFEN